MAKIPASKFPRAKKKIPSRKFPQTRSKIPSRKFSSTAEVIPKQNLPVPAPLGRPTDEQTRRARIAALKDRSDALKTASELGNE